MKTTKQKQLITNEEFYELEQEELKEEIRYMKNFACYLEACLINQDYDECLALIKKEPKPLEFLIDIIKHIPNNNYEFLAYINNNTKDIIYLSIERAIKCKIQKLNNKEFNFYEVTDIINIMTKYIYSDLDEEEYYYSLASKIKKVDDLLNDLPNKYIESIITKLKVDTNIDWTNVSINKPLPEGFIQYYKFCLNNKFNQKNSLDTLYCLDDITKSSTVKISFEDVCDTIDFFKNSETLKRLFEYCTNNFSIEEIVNILILVNKPLKELVDESIIDTIIKKLPLKGENSRCNFLKLIQYIDEVIK